ncbi:MAG TPA: hypothetical protein VKS25_00290 [Solirubrobacteraceae bacterium]|nr:hypothetical protein [Solirubrobacteraceae bacterium]
MRRLIATRRTMAKAGLALAAFMAIAGGVAYAASSAALIGPHGNINGCVSPNGGEVNLWKPGHRCSGGRVIISWPAHSIAGPAGPAGHAGATGPTGATGPSNPAATTLDGETVAKLQLKEATPGSGSATQTLYSGGGLTISALCSSGGTASLQANGPASADSELAISGLEGTSSTFGSETATLGPSSNATLGSAGSGESTFSYENTAGQVISGHVGYQSAPSLGTFAGCGFFGVATVG